MNRPFRILAVALGTLALSACSAQVAPPEAPTIREEIAPTATGGIRRQAVTISATVEKVDQKSRKVSLLGFDGTRETITVGDEVKNLPQVKKGDQVVVTYYQAIAFEVLAKGEERPSSTAAAGLAAAEPGETPGGLAAETVTVVVDVVKLDPDNSTAVIRGPEGNTTSVDIHNPAVFQKVKVGDKVEIRLTEAVAIDVQHAGK